jgi:hypothetical protein
MSILFEPLDDAVETIGGSGASRLSLRVRGYGEALSTGEGRGAVELRLRSYGYGEAPEVDPGEPTFGFGQSSIVLTAAGSGPGTIGGEGVSVIALQAKGWEGANHGLSTLRLLARGADVAANDIPNQVSLISTTFFGAEASYDETKILRAKALLSAPAQAVWEGTRSLRSHVEMDVAMYLVYSELITSSVEIGGVVIVDYTMMAQMADALLLGGVVSTLREAYALITDSLSLHSLANIFTPLTMADTVELNDTMARVYIGFAAMADQALIDATQTGTVTFAAVMADTVALDATALATMEGFAALRDQCDFLLRANIDDEIYVAWAVNAQLQAPTRYVNYPFNSFLRQPEGNGWTYYGLTDTGLYKLEGDDDAGTDINAHIRLGLSDLGKRTLKQLASAYLGYTADGDLRLKVVLTNTDDGAREAHTYRLYAKGADSTRDGRVKVGKGLQSVYMDFVLENIDGSDFALDVVEFMALPLARRIRGAAGGKS